MSNFSRKVKCKNEVREPKDARVDSPAFLESKRNNKLRKPAARKVMQKASRRKNRR